MIGLIWGWVIRHWAVVIISVLGSALTAGVAYLAFRANIKATNYYESPSGYQPTVGLSAGSQFFGCAHQLGAGKK